MSRLKELIEQLCPDGVEYVMLGNIAEIGTGKSDRKDAVDDGEYPFFVRSREVMRKNDYEYDDESILIPGEGGIGEIFHLVNGKYALHQRVYRVHITNNKINTAFAKYYMESFFADFINKEAVSATVKSIRKPMLQRFPVPVPPIEVQREIVRILDAMQELDDALSEELYARLTQKRFFVGCFQNSGWDEVLLRNVAESMNTGPFGSALHKEDYVEEGFPIVNPENIDNGRLVATSRIPTSKADELKRYWLRPGDIVIGRRGEMGRAAIVPDDGEQWVCGTGCFFIRFANDVNSEFVNMVMGTSKVRDYLEQNAVGSTMKNLNLKILGSTPVVFPERRTQDKLVNQLSEMTELCDAIDVELQARRKQFEYYRDKLLGFPEKVA